MRAFQILFIVLLLFSLTDAQNTSANAEKSTIQGTVMDPGGAVIPNARVSFTGKSGKVFGTSTNDDGVFRLDVNKDTYRVEFSGHGFATHVLDGYMVAAMTSMHLDMVLNVAGPSGPVRVEDPNKGEAGVFLTGTVYDPSGAVVPTARVTARNEKGETFDAVASKDGSYSIGIRLDEHRP